jgi:hypothetical protein
MPVLRLALGLAALLVACASAPLPDAGGSIDWDAVAEERVPQIVTTDPDGERRVTKLWLVVVDGQGYIRTGDTRWFANIQRDRDVVLFVGGAAYSLRAKLEVDADRRAGVNAAFRAKYGFQDRFIGWFGSREGSNILRLEPRPRPATHRQP